MPGRYTLREVGKMLGLPRSVVTGFVAAGFVTPTRGRRREYRFSFQDLVVLRAAQALCEAKIPPARIVRSLARLRAKLPERVPLAGLRIRAVGDSVVVSEGNAQWRPDDGQYVFQFEVAAPGGAIAFLDHAHAGARSAAGAQERADDWFARGAALEASQPDAARAAYDQAIAIDPRHAGARVNLGRLLHERGELSLARAVYVDALRTCGADATLLFNLAVLDEDLGDTHAAIDHYRDALALSPDLADAHFNLARVFEASGAHRDALRHWSAYRRLTGER